MHHRYCPLCNQLFDPTNDPTDDPTEDPTNYPSTYPTNNPITRQPTKDPTIGTGEVGEPGNLDQEEDVVSGSNHSVADNGCSLKPLVFIVIGKIAEFFEMLASNN